MRISETRISGNYINYWRNGVEKNQRTEQQAHIEPKEEEEKKKDGLSVVTK